jgi:hypothetical protein
MIETINHSALTEELLTITPSLEVVGMVSPEIFARVFPSLKKLFEGGQQVQDSFHRDVVFVADNKSFSQDAVACTAAYRQELLAAYETAARRQIRQRTTHLEWSNFRCSSNETATPGGIKTSVALSLATTFFPDDWAALAVRIDMADESMWPRLMTLRTQLVSLFGDAFWWSTLGYRFRLNHQNLQLAGPQQAALGMRLMGVDWDDLFGGFTTMSAYGLRSINWQTMVADAALTEWLHGKQSTLPRHSAQEQGHHIWKTGERPSIADRNAGLQAELLDYADVGNGLVAICQHHNSEWFGEDVFERWSYRWRELPMSRRAH